MNPYHFEGAISRETLERYLSRAISMAEVGHSPQRDDDLRMLHNIGAKFIGRAAFVWGQHRPEDTEAHFAATKDMVDAYRERDVDTVFQACIFEVAFDRTVSGVPVPAWAFEEFGLPVEKRTFNYEAMLYTPGACARSEPVRWCPNPGNKWMRDYFKDGGSVPDMSKNETKLWFFFRAKRYIDAGCEALHLGQIHLMNHNDVDHAHWWDLLTRIRRYAAGAARRKFVLIDAHTHGVALADGRLLFDFHSYPMHIGEIPETPEHGRLELGWRHAIYGNSLGGITPSGWTCDSLPYLVEFDNWGKSGKPGQVLNKPNWVWGCNEIDWFARQPEEYRNEFLWYAHQRVRELDSCAYLQMPGARVLAEPAHGQNWYFANTRSEASPTGFNQEETIKSIWGRT
jgi:hypothetical protein